MINPVMIYNQPYNMVNHQGRVVIEGLGKLKAYVLADKLMDNDIGFTYERVGDCVTITVAEADVKQATDLMKART